MKFVQLDRPLNVENMFRFVLITPSRYSPIEYDVCNPQKYFTIVKEGTFKIVGEVWFYFNELTTMFMLEEEINFVSM